jgi:hypothetical protein
MADTVLFPLAIPPVNPITNDILPLSFQGPVKAS